MPDLDAIRARLALANAVLCVCASYGRRFFSEDADRSERKEFPRISRFEIDPRGRLWFIDKWRGARIYVHNEYPWRSGWSRRFSEGGTLLDLCKALRDFIRTGERRFMRHFGPWPQSCCGGDLWGYGDDMPLVRRDVAALLAALDAKDKALRQAKRALDAFLPKYCFPLAPEHEEEARAIANVMANINAALDGEAQKEDDRG